MHIYFINRFFFQHMNGIFHKITVSRVMRYSQPEAPKELTIMLYNVIDGNYYYYFQINRFFFQHMSGIYIMKVKFEYLIPT